MMSITPEGFVHFDQMSRHDRILFLVRDLLANPDAMALDEIDGEFYWRLCRGEALDQMLPLIRRVAGETALENMKPKEFILAHMGDPQRSRGMLEGTNTMVYGLPQFVWSAFVYGNKIPMRSPTEIFLLKTKPMVMLRVFAPYIRGEDLESILDYFVAPHHPEPEDPVSIWSRYTFHQTYIVGQQSSDHQNSVVPPHIEILASLPIPPGFIGREYDAIVRQERQWHLKLLGTETPQDKQVAIRTWGIALLMREGASFQRALRELESVMGSLDLSQEADRQARNRLFERVPEARPCLRPR
jgi:hypothetical protein